MKVTIICLFALATLAYARPEDQYTDKFDNIDVDEIISNQRLLLPYIKCCLDQGKCTAEGKELKSHMKDALETNCSKCTETQQKNSEKVMKHLINHEPEYWNELKAKYDPTGKYASKHEKELRDAKEN